MKLEISLKQLQHLLDEQKELVIQRLKGDSYYYNPDTTESNLQPLNIDKEKFRELGMKASYPNDFNILKQYIKP